MADIAFLLLVFFLVTTTFSKENIQDERLPRKADDVTVKLKDWNILSIEANMKDQILIEGEHEVETVEEIAELVIKFYKHPGSEDKVKWPEVDLITTELCKTKIATYEQFINDETLGERYQDSLAMFEKKLKACELLGGSYKEIAPSAVVAITLNNSTKYGTYIKVLDGILTGLSQMRNELCQEKFGRSYDDLDDDIPEEKDMMDAIQMVYPKRIFKAKGVADAAGN